MEHNCERHTFDLAEGMCRACLGSFCTDCLIYPFGADEPPFCKPCAITAGGVRSTAGNPRRNVPPPEKVAKAKSATGGFLRRWRRGRAPTEDEIELNEEELVEIEAADARSLLDAQRLPSQAEEEPEPEPPPTPNIAPPGDFEDERELAHRAMPDEVAGGLDLGIASEPEVGGAPDPVPGPVADPASLVDDTPTPEREPQAFEHNEPTQADPSPVPDQVAATDAGEPVSWSPGPELAQTNPLFSADPTPATDDITLPPPPDAPTNAQTNPLFAEGPAADDSAPLPPGDVGVPTMPIDMIEPDPPEDHRTIDHRPTEPVAANADIRTPTATPAPPARTADGVDLFAAAPATRFQDLLRPVDDDDPVAEPDRAAIPVGVGAATDGTESVTAAARATRSQDLLRPVDDDDPVGVGAATDGTESVTAAAHAQTDTADSSADVRELLRRIADLPRPLIRSGRPAPPGARPTAQPTARRRRPASARRGGLRSWPRRWPPSPPGCPWASAPWRRGRPRR